MELREITSDIFDAFVYQSEKSHFMQTSAWGEVAASRRQTIYRLGLYDGEVLKATALVLEKKILHYAYFYCPRGFILDYKDKELIKEMVIRIKEWTKKHNGLYFRIDPDLIIHKLDKDANAIETNEYNLSLIDYFKELGARHKGFTIRFAESSNPRFTFRLNLEKESEELFKGFHPTTRNILKRNNPYGLRIYKGTSEEVKKFYDTMIETSSRKEIVLEPLSFFQDFYDILHKHEMSDLYIAELDLKHLKEVYAKKLEDLYAEIRLCEAPEATKRQKSKLLDLNDQVKKIEKESKEVTNFKEDHLVLSSVITAKYKDKVWIVHGGNSDHLKFVNANYELYYQIIKDAKEEGYQYVDFFGSEGKVDPNSNLYGIYLFKLRFGGDFDEFIGEFDFILKPLTNKIILTLLNARRKYLIKKAEKKA